MNLNRTTYEIYLMDYLDGKLDAVDVSDLLLFLEQNPDLKKEFEGVEHLKFAPEETGFTKNALKKPAYSAIKKSYENLLIASLEKDITPEKQVELDRAFALYPELNNEAGLFAATFLKPDHQITFKNKSKLKVFVLAPYLRIAVGIAAVSLLIGFAQFYFNDTKPGEHIAITIPDKNPVKQIKPSLPETENKQTVSRRLSKKHNSNRIHPLIETPVHSSNQDSAANHANYEVIPQNFATEVTVEIANVPIEKITHYVARPHHVTITPDEFIDVRTWLTRLLKKEVNLNNKDGLLARVNKATRADIVIEKDTTTGKLTRFEIAGIGFGKGN